MVWVVAPKTRTVTVYLPGGEARVLHENDRLSGGDVVPGFELPVRRIFE
jgi:Uma2 family endonuclease